MSLKDVIMTLNDFYSSKLENLHTLLTNELLTSEETEKIDQIVKDNEVRIPYDEDIFVGIDKNYKVLKKVLNIVKEKNTQIKEKDAEILRLREELEKLKGKGAHDS
mmetsp:Transcript_38120/g.37629  ORF Transcript_38120/g.37629 Transcript_38120/m.37629 type:complete len:106 (+) Transcript_38120:687-1004(+)